MVRRVTSNKLLKHRSGAKTCASTGLPTLRFGSRLARRYAFRNIHCLRDLDETYLLRH